MFISSEWIDGVPFFDIVVGDNFSRPKVFIYRVFFRQIVGLHRTQSVARIYYSCNI